jgi:hypothetical protein
MESLNVQKFEEDFEEAEEKKRFEQDLIQVKKEFECIKQISLDLNKLVNDQDLGLNELVVKQEKVVEETGKTVEILKDAAKIQGNTWKLKLQVGFSAIGSAIGAIAGPVGVAIGGSIGMIAGKVVGKGVEKQNLKDLDNI